MWDWARNNGAVVSFSWNDSPVLISFLNSLDEILHLFFSKQCLRSSQSLSRILLWFWNKFSRHLWSMWEFQLCTRSRLCPRRKKAMVGEGEKKRKKGNPPPFNIFPSFFPPCGTQVIQGRRVCATVQIWRRRWKKIRTKPDLERGISDTFLANYPPLP